MAKSHSQKLRRLQRDEGAKIVVAAGPYAGDVVEFAPRHPLSAAGTGPTDREPWVTRSKTFRDPETGEYEVLERFSGAECQVATEEDE